MARKKKPQFEKIGSVHDAVKFVKRAKDLQKAFVKKFPHPPKPRNANNPVMTGKTKSSKWIKYGKRGRKAHMGFCRSCEKAAQYAFDLSTDADYVKLVD